MDSSPAGEPRSARSISKVRFALRPAWLLLALACGLSACGGGSGGSTSASSGQVDNSGHNLPPPPPPPPTPDATGSTEPMGRWSEVFPWPQVAIHLHLLPNGKVMSWQSESDAEDHAPGRLANTRAYVVDIPDGGAPQNPVFVPNTQSNLFCGGHTFLPDGRLFVTGGDFGGAVGIPDTNIFDYRNNTWQRVGDMNAGRWYPSTMTLANGDVLTVSGLIDLERGHNLIPQVWNPVSGWRDLSGASRYVELYSPLHLAPNGKVFMSGSDVQTMYLDTSGTGKWSEVAYHNHEIWRDYAPSVIYDNGKVIVMGGGDPPVNTVETIDLNEAAPKWKWGKPMALARRHHNATIMADGKILVTGGTSSDGFNDATKAALAAESWDPKTGEWSTMASMKIPRVYHSTALLLPDGRVLSTGGGQPAPVNGVNNLDAEIYSPPYLFNGPRPVIASAPATVRYGQRFTVETPDAANVVKATWIRLSSVTHTFNMNQRINHLPVQTTTGGLSIVAPSDPNLTPPGHYMLFLINAKGVPSVAKIVQIL